MDAQSDFWSAVPISANVQPLHDWGGGEIRGDSRVAEGDLADRSV
jgi:hypothetical protein